MMLRTKHGLLFSTLCLFFLLDRLIKNKIQHGMHLGESVPVIDQVFHITYVQNAGAAFSLFHSQPQLLLSVTVLLFAGFLVYCLKKSVDHWMEPLAMGLILGGALGNIIDRMMIGRVVDYLDVTCINYPVFNLADAGIFCGILILLWHHWRHIHAVGADDA